MKPLGTIPGTEIVLEKDEGLRAYKPVTFLPELPCEHRIVQLANNLTVGDQTYMSGSIFINEETEWKLVTPPEKGLGPVMSIRCPRIENDVRIRWIDPFDRSPYHWKHTLLIRKYGSFPTSVYDGVVVIDSYVRDKYLRNSLHDFVPRGTEDNWFYRFYVFSEDEVAYTDDSCTFRPLELNWATIKGLVQAGLGPKIFSTGDSIVIENVNGGDKWNTIDGMMEFEVIGFDLVVPDRKETLPRTMTLMSTEILIDEIPFDKPWSKYVITLDKYVTSATKQYYQKQGDEFVPVHVTIGDNIEDRGYYEEVTNKERIDNGGNRWSKSWLKAWLNGTTPEGTINPPRIAFKDCGDESGKFLNALTPVKNTTGLPSVDGTTYDVSIDTFFVLSKTEVFGKTSDWYKFNKTTDKSPKDSKQYWVYDTELANYRKAIDNDFTVDHEFKEGVIYYEQFVSNVEENKFASYLSSDELRKRDNFVGPVAYWLRSADRFTSSNVCLTNEKGELVESSPVKDQKHGLVLACVIG